MSHKIHSSELKTKSFHHGQNEGGVQLPSTNTSNILTQMLHNIILFKSISHTWVTIDSFLTEKNHFTLLTSWHMATVIHVFILHLLCQKHCLTFLTNGERAAQLCVPITDVTNCTIVIIIMFCMIYLQIYKMYNNWSCVYTVSETNNHS